VHICKWVKLKTYLNFSHNQNTPQKYKISSDAQKSSGQSQNEKKMCSALIDTGSKLYNLGLTNLFALFKSFYQPGKFGLKVLAGFPFCASHRISLIEKISGSKCSACNNNHTERASGRGPRLLISILTIGMIIKFLFLPYYLLLLDNYICVCGSGSRRAAALIKAVTPSPSERLIVCYQTIKSRPLPLLLITAEKNTSTRKSRSEIISWCSGVGEIGAHHERNIYKYINLILRAEPRKMRNKTQ